MNRILKTKEASSQLTPEEYFIWSQVGAKISLADLASLCPWSKEELVQKVESMIKKNALEWEAPKKIEISAPPEVLNQLNEDGPDYAGLEPEIRAEILIRYSRPEDASPYEVLDLEPKSSEPDVKARYFELSKKFHPDRYFRKDLGHYKPKLESIFARIQKAFSLLKDPHQKEAIDRMFSLKEKTTEPKSAKSFFKLGKEMEAFGKAEYNYKQGLQLESSQDFLGAYNAFMLARQIDPKREIFEKAVERVRPLMHQQKVNRIVESVMSTVQMVGSSPELVQSIEDALRIDPRHPGANLLMGRFILELGPKHRMRDAKEMLLRAKGADSKSAEPCYYLARALESLGELKGALKEVKEALKRNPQHAPSKKLLEKLK